MPVLHNSLRWMRRFCRDDDGPTAVEYGVMVALIVVSCISSIRFLGGSSDGVWGKNAERLETQVWSTF